jgi:flagellar hook-associated protein 2
MAAISSAGVGSGLDIESIITGLMNVEKAPLTLVSTQKTNFQAKLSAFGSLKSALSTFQTSVTALSTAAKFNAQTATSGNTSLFTATANGAATTGDYAVTVSQLAKSQKIAMAGMANTTDIIGTGTLSISFGTYTPAVTTPTAAPATFVDNTDKAAINITIDSSNNTLAGVRDAINASNSSVSATIVNDGSTNRLVITSKDTGEVNSLKIAVTDDDGTNGDASGLSQLAFDPLATAGSGNNMSIMQQAKNALLNIDGIDIVKQSNTITDAIEGVTLNILGLSDANSTQLSVASDQTKIKESVTSFVDAFNKVNETLRKLTKYDETGTASGKLLGDATARSVINQIRGIVTKAIPTGNAITSLSDIGVTFQRDGTLAVEDTKLSDAITNHFSDMADLFSISAKTSDSQVTFIGSNINTKAGTYAINVSQLGTSTSNAVGTINGVSATGFGYELMGAVGDDSAGLLVKVGGSTLGARGTVTFTKGYAAQLDDVLTQLLDSEGILETKTSGINDSISRLDKQTDAINLRLTAIEKRYRAQFTKLDALLNSLQNTSSYLTQQIAALNNN